MLCAIPAVLEEGKIDEDDEETLYDFKQEVNYVHIQNCAIRGKSIRGGLASYYPLTKREAIDFYLSSRMATIAYQLPVMTVSIY